MTKKEKIVKICAEKNSKYNESKTLDNTYKYYMFINMHICAKISLNFA